MPEQRQPYHTMTLRLPQETAERLDRHARRLGLTRTELLRLLAERCEQIVVEVRPEAV